MEVRGVAGDLELSEHTRLLRHREVEGEERVDLLEGDDVADVAGETNGVDALTLPQPADPACLNEPAVPLAQRRQERLGLAACSPPRR